MIQYQSDRGHEAETLYSLAAVMADEYAERNGGDEYPEAPECKYVLKQTLDAMGDVVEETDISESELEAFNDRLNKAFMDCLAFGSHQAAHIAELRSFSGRL